MTDIALSIWVVEIADCPQCSDLDNCAIGDEDLDDLAACFDNVGRSSVEVMYADANAVKLCPSPLPGGMMQRTQANAPWRFGRNQLHVADSNPIVNPNGCA